MFVEFVLEKKLICESCHELENLVGNIGKIKKFNY